MAKILLKHCKSVLCRDPEQEPREPAVIRADATEPGGAVHRSCDRDISSGQPSARAPVQQKAGTQGTASNCPFSHALSAAWKRRFNLSHLP